MEDDSELVVVAESDDTTSNEKEGDHSHVLISSKPLRLCEPDLIVILGDDLNQLLGGDEQAESCAGRTTNSRGDGSKQLKSYSQILAGCSSYIDMALTMQANRPYELKFPDISPDTWDMMMKYLHQPSQVHPMTTEDALWLAPFYDKYDFAIGMQLCDHVLKEYFVDFREASQRENQTALNIEKLVEALLIANQAHAAGARQKGLQLLKEMLADNNKFPYNRTSFAVTHMEALAPLIAEALEEDEDFMQSFGWSREDVESPYFPDRFVLYCYQLATLEGLHKGVKGIKLSGTGTDFDGEYRRKLSGSSPCAEFISHRFAGYKYVMKKRRELANCPAPKRHCLLGVSSQRLTASSTT